MEKFKIQKKFAFLLLVICFTGIASPAQNDALVRYFDSSWNKTSKDSAYFFTEMVKVDSIYRCTSYWMKTKKLNCKSAYTDTLFTKPVGVLLRYYENGKIEDSTYFYENGVIKNTYHFYNNGKLWVHYTFNLKTKAGITEAFDLNGNKIQDFIYSKEASFQEGGQDWSKYISENVKTKIPLKNGAPLGSYQVVIRFIVGKNGKTINVEPETNFGYGMEEEVIRVIKKSPKWNPAILMGKTVDTYHRQPLTFIVEKE